MRPKKKPALAAGANVLQWPTSQRQPARESAPTPPKSGNAVDAIIAGAIVPALLARLLAERAAAA